MTEDNRIIYKKMIEKLKSMTVEERMEWFKNSYSFNIRFIKTIADTVYLVNTHFDKTKSESIYEKTERLLLNN